MAHRISGPYDKDPRGSQPRKSSINRSSSFTSIERILSQRFPPSTVFTTSWLIRYLASHGCATRRGVPNPLVYHVGSLSIKR
jgi:hypothetical protein